MCVTFNATGWGVCRLWGIGKDKQRGVFVFVFGFRFQIWVSTLFVALTGQPIILHRVFNVVLFLTGSLYSIF